MTRALTITLALGLSACAIDEPLEIFPSDEDINEFLNAGKPDAVCSIMADCLLDYCTPQVFSHPARQAEWASGCMEVCAGMNDIADHEWGRARQFRVFACETGMDTDADSCRPAVAFCRGASDAEQVWG